jgi:hypothetical protein
MIAGMALWNVGIELDRLGDEELHGRLLLALSEPVDVTVGPRVGTGMIAVGVLVEAGTAAEANDAAETMLRDALAEVGLDDTQMVVYHTQLHQSSPS